MPFSATVNLGTVGVAITSVKLYGCTGTSGGSCTGCTALTGYESVSVSTFPLLVSGIPNGVTYIQAEALGACSADLVKQCISISGIPGATPAPTSTPTPTPTGTSAPGATPNPTSTLTPTPTQSMTPTPSATTGAGPTPIPTNTPTPSATSLPGCGSVVSGTFTEATFNNYDNIQLDFSGVANGSIISFTCTANNRPNNISIRTDLEVIDSTGWFGSSEGYDSEDYWYPTEGTGPITLTITYDNTKTYYIDTLTAEAALLPPNDESDYWEVNISCGVPAATPTPSPTTPPLFGYFRSGGQSNIDTFCSSPGYQTSAEWYSTGTTLSAAISYTRVYENTDYVPFNGYNLWYAVATDNINTLNDGQFNAIQIDNDGYITSTALRNCAGGGGGGLT
jgi:hypothetical protein